MSLGDTEEYRLHNIESKTDEILENQGSLKDAFYTGIGKLGDSLYIFLIEIMINLPTHIFFIYMTFFLLYIHCWFHRR